MAGKAWIFVSVTAAAITVTMRTSVGGGWMAVDRETAIGLLRKASERLGFWAMPAYVLAHTLTLVLCLPYAVFFEAGAALLFGFIPAVACVFSAKVLAASLSFLLGRAVFRRSKSAMQWATRSKHFQIVARGVKRDGWRFVLLARFSPLPSYVINYALAATEVGFFVDFLLPTIMGCIPMILQNTSIGSLASAAVSSTTGTKKSQIYSYLLPGLGVASSIFISLKIKKYSSEFSANIEHSSCLVNGNVDDHSATDDMCGNPTDVGQRRRN